MIVLVKILKNSSFIVIVVGCQSSLGHCRKCKEGLRTSPANHVSDLKGLHFLFLASLPGAIFEAAGYVSTAPPYQNTFHLMHQCSGLKIITTLFFAKVEILEVLGRLAAIAGLNFLRLVQTLNV